jgi:hypothetical protein
MNASKDQINAIPEIGDVIAQSIFHGFLIQKTNIS